MVAQRFGSGLGGILTGFAVALLLAQPATGFAAAAGDDFEAPVRTTDLDVDPPPPVEIPSVVERPSLPTAGPFFDVRDVRIVGITDRPEIGLSVDELRAIARRTLAEQANEEELADQGYSSEELRTIARYMDRVWERDERARRQGGADAEIDQLSKSALMDELIALVRVFQSRRVADDDSPERQMLNVFDVDAVAEAVQVHIRSRGLVLAQVVVPPQRVREGVVELRVYPGELGDVVVAGNEVVDAGPLEAAFADVTGQPVLLDDVDERLRLANDLGGVDITGVFVPGRSPGETRLRLDTVNERRWLASTRFDNHGTKITGRTRGLLSATLFDATGAGDELTATFLRSEGPDPVELLNFGYYRPLPGLRNFVQAGFSKNEFTISGVQDIIGDTTNYDLALGTFWERSRDRNLNQTVFVSYKDAELTLPGPTAAGIDRTQKIVEFGTTLNYDTLVEGWRAVVDGSTTLRIGSITAGRTPGTVDPNTGDIFDGQDKDFVVLQQRLRLFQLLDITWPVFGTTTRHSLLVNLNGQFTEQLLPAVDRFNLGGADGVRSLVVDDISVDKGVVANFNFYTTIPESLDFDLPARFNQRFSEAVRPYIFYDYGYGVTKAGRVDASTQDDTWFEFTGYGIGLEYNLFKDQRGEYALRGAVSWAWPSTSRFGDELFETVIEDEDRIYADITLEIDQNDWPFWGGRRNR